MCRSILLSFLILLCTNLAVADAKSSQASKTQITQHNNKVDHSALYNKFKSVFEKIGREYVQEPNYEQMFDAALSGMISSLDPHSSYFNGEEMKDFLEQTEGQFSGVGVEVVSEAGVVKVISPIDGLPAERAGIKAGDWIVSVDDESIINVSFHSAIKKMRGPTGTNVKLTVVREGEQQPLDFNITREIIQIKPVKYILSKGVMYVRISVFNEHTANELKRSFAKVLAEEKIEGIILDLRNNPGGLLDQAVGVSEYFIDSGMIVTIKGRYDNNSSVIFASPFVTKAPNVPMVTMINSGSASASEIVAAALQDRGRSIIVGTKSFGKGSVQTFAKLDEKSGMKITTARYYTPNGRSIQAEGVIPDIIIQNAKVEYKKSKDDERRKVFESSLRNHLQPDKSPDSSNQKSPVEADPKDTKDAKNQPTSKESKDNARDNQKDNSKDSKKKLDEPKVSKNLSNIPDQFTNDENSELYEDYQYANAFNLLKGMIILHKRNDSEGRKDHQ